ncbi:MAP kinase-activated protein kinase 2 (Fragment) [Seminavis robusta]|uniref:MAP kinase-activated protein kinase 2 n=1 Tax=Seminavis robusta TaxID=568900 RepID=A0A9N8DRI9_9STRA
MATAVDSPTTSPLSSPVSSRRMVDIKMNQGLGRLLSCPSNPLGPLKVGPFAFHQDSDVVESSQCTSASIVNQQQQQQRIHDTLDNNNESSQFSFQSASQGGEVLTQNMEYTQMTQDANECSNMSLSPFPTVEKPPLSWGRLMPCDGGKTVELEPRAPVVDPKKKTANLATSQSHTGPSFSLVGLDNLRPCDNFNAYSLGRSAKCDVSIKRAKTHRQDSERDLKVMEWTHGLISNRHATIYCCLPDAPRANNNKNTLPASSMQVWIEDSSYNGTWINGSILLKRGQKRMLHSGDEISFVGKELLRRRVRDEARLQAVYQQYAFVFVNVAHQHFKPTAAAAASTPFPTKMNIRPMSSAKKRAGLVNPRAMNYPPGSRSPKPKTPGNNNRAPYSAAKQPVHPTPKSGNGQQSLSSSPGYNNPQSTAVKTVSSSPRRIEQDYDIRDLLGRGTCGEVRRAIHRQTGKAHAVKIVSLPPPSLTTGHNLQEQQQWLAEARILQTLEHPYIVRLVDVFYTEAHLYLILDLCAGGDLFDSIIKSAKYSETNSRRITDFGVAKSASSELKTFCGTPLYFAPEVLERRHTVDAKGRYGKEADVWSLGVILYILLSGTPPYNIDGAAGMDVILRKSSRISFPPEYWTGVSAQAVDLVNRMLDKAPKSRITVREACDHPWILSDDGDTHCHPLEDPRLMSVTRKRLFPSARSPVVPTPFTTALSPQKQPPSKKRRKVSMESGRASLLDNELEVPVPQSKASSPVANNNIQQRPLSPVENILESAGSPQGSPSGTGKRLTAALQGENDENSACGEFTAVVAVSKQIGSKQNTSIMKPKAVAANEPKISTAIISSLKSRILNAGKNVLPGPPALDPRDTGAFDKSKERKKVVSPHSAGGPEATTKTALWGQGNVPKSAFRGIERPAHWNKSTGTTTTNNSSSTVGIGSAKVIASDSAKKAGGVTGSKKKATKTEGLVKAEELPEDRICSQFSDEEGDDVTKADKVCTNGGLSKPLAKSSEVSTSSSALSSKKSAPAAENTAKAPAPKSQTRKAKTTAKSKSTATTKGSKGGKKSSQGGASGKSKSKKEDNQATLSRWFQPVKKSS